ncbi:MAG: transketolase [Candidatus Dormibacteraeota bacterium]|nr:transketolase [Candidatus Dormibacteraeota bacterium]MBO0759812.1 transketolase [Candidatus Dormibacteraeota bacterium]
MTTAGTGTDTLLRSARGAYGGTPMDTLAVNTVRTLCMDAVQRAKSGHPGTPMGMAPVVYTLWQRFLRFDPEDPTWPNRDRFVLSAGHASTLLYSMLHLAGVQAVDAEYETVGELAVRMQDLETFRQLGSKCPGHPEYRLTSGVETTTGPLGQGVATSVGMAIASRWCAAHFNRPGHTLFDFDVYALTGDGCMMEGVSNEAASLAGHLRLSNLCWIYDNNHITIEGSTSLAFTEDVAARFLGLQWNVTRVGDANDLGMVARAFETFRRETQRPTLIMIDSHIGYGAPHVQDTRLAHGEPLGEDEERATKRFYGWPEDAKFLVPDGVREHFAEGVGRRGSEAHAAWRSLLSAYRDRHPDLADELERMQHRRLPDGWDADLPVAPPDPRGMSGRDASVAVLNAIAPRVPWLIGGAADLAPSTKTRLTFEGAGDFEPDDPAGRNFHFGIREHAMGAIVNGLSLSKIRGYASGFFIFTEYMRQPIRLGALMQIPTILVFTHDSIGVGEDGPTHQPVEQLPSLRSMPGLVVLRPGDANEVAEAWRLVMQFERQSAVLVLSRQAMPTLDRTRYAPAAGVAHGAYVLADVGASPELIMMASGSEVSLALEAHEQLVREGVRSRVVSMPSWELFERQPSTYREEVLPASVTARVAVEQASSFGWDRYVGPTGETIAMHTFGASAPLADVQRRFGFTPERVVEAARAQLAKEDR